MPDIDTVPLGKRLAIALLLPVGLLVVVGVLLALQVERMRAQTRWVAHTDQVIAKAFDAHRQVLNQETSVRGYLLSRDPAFLEPYRAADPPRALRELVALVGDEASERQIRELSELYQQWHAEIVPALRPQNVEDAATWVSMDGRRRKMDVIRRSLREFLEEQQRLRDERVARAEQTTRITFLAFIVLLGSAAVGIAWVSRHQLSRISQNYQRAFSREREARSQLEASAWIRTAQIELSSAMQGELSLQEIAERTLRILAPKTDAHVGAFYVRNGDEYTFQGGYGLDASHLPERFRLGQGLVGQVAKDRELMRLTDVPNDYLRIYSATGERTPVEVVILPAVVDDETLAVVELAYLRPVAARSMELLERVTESTGVAVRSAAYRIRLRELLEQSQKQAELLTTQQEELRSQNEELEEQSQALQEAQARLETQQVELEQSNENLSLHSGLLEQQNDALRKAQQELQQTASEVERANQYKSEFLANMSHELRTPLNSSLILAKLLADNPDGNLSPEQVRFASTIYAAGNDLLALINDILDLSKIEAGKMDVHVARVSIDRVMEPVVRMFEPIAKERGLSLQVRLPDAPEHLETDATKVQQIVNNLVANALKFTERGSVQVRVFAAPQELWCFEITDTGIGIPVDQQALIFEAFRQADGTAARKFAGTGLGLAISRDLARLLGGSIRLSSQPGQGSTFTLTLPTRFQGPTRESVPPVAPSQAPDADRPPRGPNERPEPIAATSHVPDDRALLDDQKRLLLVIEDDPKFASILVDLAHELDFQCVAAASGEEGLQLASQLAPSAIVLDMQLPDCSGLSVLDRLKRNPKTRHMPVHVASVSDYSQTARHMGAVGYMLKPAKREQLVGALQHLEATFTRTIRRVLVVEDDPALQQSICALLGGERVETRAVAGVAEALRELRTETFDCVVTDLRLEDGTGYDLLQTMANDESCSFPPIIVYTGQTLTADEEQRLRRFSDSIIVKGARSPERLLDEVTLFLHQVESELPIERQRMLKQTRDREAIFEGRRILIVEDDVRNIFALSSILEPKGAKLDIARNGQEALEALDRIPDIDMVLMDVMMPVMDGLQATREIRKRPALAKLPIIALTAKAMQDDQEKCLQAGANDYAAKPLDIERLLSLVRVWMPR